MATVEQRVGQLEGMLPSLATKDDLCQLEVRLTKEIGHLEIRLIKWMVGIQFGGMVAIGAIAGAVVGIMKLLGG